MVLEGRSGRTARRMSRPVRSRTREKWKELTMVIWGRGLRPFPVPVASGVLVLGATARRVLEHMTVASRGLTALSRATGLIGHRSRSFRHKERVSLVVAWSALVGPVHDLDGAGE